MDPVATIHDLGPGWHMPTPPAHPARDRGRPSPRLRLRPGVLDWEAYLGALEEIGYRGFLTVWPDPAGDPRAQFQAVVSRLGRLS